MRRRANVLLPALVVVICSTTPAYGQATPCEGEARASTTETRHFNCHSPEDALRWTLNIVCIDACGKAWFSPAAQSAAVDGSCHASTGTFCTPPYNHRSYTNGLYAETSAFPTAHRITDGRPVCYNLPQVITSGDCPCAPTCGESETPNPVIQGCAPECGSPLVVDLDRRGFEFTDVAGGVTFDLDGDGQGERIAWLTARSADGWLVLDRNGNGVIDNGSELFGDFTPQPATAEPHGYLALAVFDTAPEGGNDDGVITAADSVFDALRLWIDADHDGVSQSHELVPLDAARVHEVDLAFVESRRRDRHGNELRYAGRVRLERGTTRSVDVFLLKE